MVMVAPNERMKAFRAGFIELLREHAGDIDSSEMCAIAAYTVGQMMAMLDAKKWTPAKALDLVGKNIEAGNADAIERADKWMPRA